MSAQRHKTLAVSIKSAGTPTDAQLAAIRTYTLADMPAEKLYVRTFALCHNAIDRDKECFDEALLADFARTLPGKGLFIKHPGGWDGDSGPGKGRWFGATLERMGLDEARELLRTPDLKFPPGVQTAVLLMADVYLVRTAGNADLLDEIDAGVVSDVSIGFSAADSERLHDEQGNELNVWRLKGPGEALEGSLVWLGAQPGARAIKGAQRREEDPMYTEQQFQAEKSARETAENAAKALQRQLDEAQASHGIVQKAREALGDHAHLIEKPDVLADAVKSANAYRDSLIDDIVLGERSLGLCGDDDESVTAAKAIYAGEGIENLKKRADRARAALAKGGRMPGGDPAAPRSNAGTEPAGLAGNPALG